MGLNSTESVTMSHGPDHPFSSLAPAVDSHASLLANSSGALGASVDTTDRHASSLHDFARHPLTALFDAMSLGVLLVSPCAKVLHSNAASRDAMASSDLLSVQNGQLVAASPTDQRALLAALSSASKGIRSLLSLSAESNGLLLAVEASALQPAFGNDPVAQSAIALFFQRPSICDASVFLLFARKFGLTPTEQQVLTFLCRSWLTPDIATELNVAVSTVRSHVRSMCTKTASKGSRDLINRIAMLPSAGYCARQRLH